MSDLEQTQWLMASLPNCAAIYKAEGWRGRPNWVIVRFHVPPEEARPDDMKKMSGVFESRTQALRASAKEAKERNPPGTEKSHTGVWRIEEDGKVFWQTVWPV